jgi:hypothetical protein
VHVDEDHRRLGARFVDEFVDHLEGAARNLEKEAAHHVDHGDERLVARGHDRQAAPGCVPREVRGSHDARLGVDPRREIGAPPCVVAEGDRVRAELEQLARELRRQPDAVGGVLAVHDAEVDVELVAQAFEPRFQRRSPRHPDDVRDEEKSQGSASAVAGKTWTVTWFPASCV